MNEDSGIYFQASLFRCECCLYETEIYYNEENLTGGVDNLCACNRVGHYKFSPIYISRDDLDDIVLHGQFASLPEDKNFCTQCLGKPLVSWQEIVPMCIKCKKESMHFVNNVEGKNISLYAEWCRDWARPSHPDMIFIDEKGSQIFVINGLLSGISAT